MARWQDFVGTGEWMRSLQSRVGRLRDRVGAALTGRPSSADSLHGALESGVETLLRSEAERAADRTVTAWRSLPGGGALVAGREEELGTVSPDFSPVAAEEVRDWQGFVLDLVREQGAGKRSQARLLSWGINGAGAVVMVAVFASTAGLSGAELAIAGGTTAVGQRVLEAVFGDAAVRSLAERARADLATRADGLLGAERDRFTGLIIGTAPAPQSADAVRAAAAELAVARRRA
jgi:hypothetical protein